MPATPNEKCQEEKYIEGSAAEISVTWNSCSFLGYECHPQYHNIDIRRSKVEAAEAKIKASIWTCRLLVLPHWHYVIGITNFSVGEGEDWWRSSLGLIGFTNFSRGMALGEPFLGRSCAIATGYFYWRKSQGWSDSQSNQKHISKPCQCLLFESQLCCFKYSQSFVSFLIFRVAKSHFLMLESLLLSGDSWLSRISQKILLVAGWIPILLVKCC